MPRLLGVDIPANKKIVYALRYIYGVGPTRAAHLCTLADIDPSIRASQLSEEQLNKFTHAIQEKGWSVEGNLRRESIGSIKRLQAIRSYRGLRHQRGLPVRGQRTQTNARTRKGKNRPVGVQVKG